MAQKRGRRRRKNKNKVNEIAGIILIAFAVLCAVAIYFNIISVFGEMLSALIFGACGIFGYAVPVLIAAFGIVVIVAKKRNANAGKIWLIVLLLFFVMSLLHIPVVQSAFKGDSFLDYLQNSFEIGNLDHRGGGVLGALLMFPSYLYLGIAGSYIVFIAGIAAVVLALTNLSIKKMGVEIGHAVKTTYEDCRERVEENRRKKQEEKLFVMDLNQNEEDRQEYAQNPYDIRIETGVNRINVEKVYKNTQTEQAPAQEDDLSIYSDTQPLTDVFDFQDNTPEEHDFEPVMEDIIGLSTQEKKQSKTARKITPAQEKQDDLPVQDVKNNSSEPYVYPPISLLAPLKKQAARNNAQDNRRKAEMLERTLQNFGISAKVESVSQGPVVTRYEIKPAAGIKVSRIVNLADDIALSFAVAGVRIEAPIPGKAAVGIEVPNESRAGVHIRELLDCEEFAQAKSKTTFALGKDIAGKNVYADIAKMPHLLIAGETGAGKSVCVNSLIASILFHASPQEVRMIMIDPKMVELDEYNNIPHLLIPVVTDAKKASAAMQWAVSEMTMRYRMFANAGAKDLERYNRVIAKEDKEPLPKIVIIIDELADLMMVSKKEVEDSICRIAQLGRAAGIHLVIATQRPSVDVITGLIKANIPSRIALTVSSQQDSRTILDRGGAEKLLGRGDMLFHPTGAPKSLRVQGCYIDDREIQDLCDFIKSNTQAEYDNKVIEDISKDKNDLPEDEDDQTDVLFAKALKLVVESDQASISMIQRRLRVGYARAARLIDEMEIRGYVSEFEGSKARKVLITKEQYNELYGDVEGTIE